MKHSGEARRARAVAFALLSAAKALEADAARLRTAAQAQDGLADWHGSMARVPALLADLRERVERGEDEDAARHAIARTHGLLPESLARWQADDEQRRTSARLWRRDREVMRLAWAGRTNSEIAEEIGRRGYKPLHPKHVSRIISGCLRHRAHRVPPGASMPPEKSLTTDARFALSHSEEMS